MTAQRYLLPFGLLAVVVGLLGTGLTVNPRDVPSPLIDRQVPMFRLPQLHDETRIVTPDEFIGRVWLLNVWASWCEPCRQEHSLLVNFSKTGAAPIFGLDYKDEREDGMEWLREAGNPYMFSMSDLSGRTSIDLGVFGVPETFVIDRKGIIRFKHVGPLTSEVLHTKILPLIKELNG